MAAITRTQAETILVRRRGKLMTRIGLDGTTISGSNADLADPIAFSVRQLGLSVADPSNPTDLDLTPVLPSAIDQFLDVAEWRVLYSCLGNWAKTTQQAGTDKQQFTDLLNELRQQLKQRTEELKLLYGQGLAGLQSGTVDLDIVSQDDPTTLTEIFN